MSQPTNQLAVFNFDNNKVRIILDENNQPLFVAKDVATILGYKRPNDAINQFCKGTVIHRPLVTNGGTQNIRVIYEPDLYRLIFGSKLESAVRFQDWVFNEVLPTIRKTGSYQTANTATTTASPVKEYSDSDLQHLKHVYNIPQLAKVLGVSEPQAIQRLYQSYADTANDIKLIDTNTQAILNQFWAVVSQLDLNQINHSKKPYILAISLPEVYALAGQQLPDKTQLQHALQQSLMPKFQQANHVVSSRITNQAKRCWNFLTNSQSQTGATQ